MEKGRGLKMLCILWQCHALKTWSWVKMLREKKLNVWEENDYPSFLILCIWRNFLASALFRISKLPGLDNLPFRYQLWKKTLQWILKTFFWAIASNAQVFFNTIKGCVIWKEVISDNSLQFKWSNNPYQTYALKIDSHRNHEILKNCLYIYTILYFFYILVIISLFGSVKNDLEMLSPRQQRST